MQYVIIFTNYKRAREFNYDLHWNPADGIQIVNINDNTYIVAHDSMNHLIDIKNNITPGNRVVILHHTMPTSENLKNLTNTLTSHPLNCNVNLVRGLHGDINYDVLIYLNQIIEEQINR